MFFDQLPKNSKGIAKMLDILYAAEIHSAEQYWNHSLRVSDHNLIGFLDEHARDEMRHAKMIRCRLHELGVPLHNSFGRILDRLSVLGIGDIEHADGDREMLHIDLSGEEIAIKAYTEACAKTLDVDPASFIMLASILADEYEHKTELINISR